jgi:hypothetical protein
VGILPCLEEDLFQALTDEIPREAEPTPRTAGNEDRSSVPILRCSQERPASAARAATPTASALPAGPSLEGHARAIRTGLCSWRVASCSLLFSGAPHDPQKRFISGFSWPHRGHGTCCSVMVFACPPSPVRTSSHFTLASGYICASQPSDEVDHLVSKESLYSGALGIPTASTAAGDTDRGLTCRNRRFSGSFIPFNDDAVGAGDVL